MSAQNPYLVPGPMADTAPVLYGKYQLLELLARGGMAEVYRAKAHGVEGFEKILVIKRILPELSKNPRFVEMFINEAKIAVSLSHANIVQVFDLGRAEDTYFIAMEHVAGMDLASLLRLAKTTGRPLAPELAVFIMSELCKALDYAHRRRDAQGHPLNIVHRDVSPQNILLSHEGEVKLTDFGIAKARTFAQKVTDYGIVKGKYSYLAPEQLTGGKVDPRTDIFAAGVVLYEALTGANPFRSNSAYNTLQRVRTGDIRPLHELVPDIGEALQPVIDRALATDPERRYAEAGRLYEDLMQFLYQSGGRAGGRELSEYLDELREARGEARNESGNEELKQVFEAEHVTAYDLARQHDTRVGIRNRAKQVPRSRPPPLRPKTERRDVTTLAIRATRDDPLNADAITRLVRRLGGTTVEDPPVHPEKGESVLFVLFGERDPDGRDTEVAARTALRISRAATAAAAAAGERTSVSIGVYSGRVVVNLAGDLLEDESYTRVLQRALELAEQAAASQVLANPHAEKALRGRFRLTPASEGPTPVFILASERSLTEAYGRFIARREELRRIGEVLAAANRSELQVLGLCGEAGSGKSRLLVETLRRLSASGRRAGMHVATCTPQMRNVPLGTIQEMLRVVLGVDEFDPEPLMRERTTRLRELGLVASEQRAVAAALGLSTQEQGPERGERSLKSAVLHIVRKLAEDRLTIFAWDGAEHMDEASQRMIDGLLRTVKHARVAVVLAYRPGYVPPWTDHPGFTRLDIEPLAEDDIAKLLASRLSVDEIPLELLREVSTKSGGNPLYVEEHLKALVSCGVVRFEANGVRYNPDRATVEIPKTLRGIIASRIARLGLLSRYLLQVAAITGSRFHVDVVAGAANEETAAVAAAFTHADMQGIVVRQGPAEHAFAHELVHQVVLESLTLETRRELHAAVARTLEDLYPEHEDEMAGRLARHYREAGDHARAVTYWERAAVRLERERDLESAIDCLVRGIDLLSKTADPDPKRTLDLYVRLGELSYRARDLTRGAERMQAALELAESLHDDGHVARLALWRGRLLVSTSQAGEGRRWLDHARHAAKGLADPALSRDVLIAMAEAEARSGAYEKAVEYLREALQLEEGQNESQARLRCLMPLALTYARMGSSKLAFETLAEARVEAGSRAGPWIACDLYKLESQIQYHARKPQALIEAASKALQIAREVGFAYEASLNAHNMGEAYLRIGDHKQAFASLRYSYEVASEHGFTKLQMANMRILGFIDATRFGSSEGRARLIQAIEYAEVNRYVWDVIQGRYLLALVEQRAGEKEAAGRHLRQVLKLAAEHGHRKYVEDTELALRQLSAGQPVQLQS